MELKDMIAELREVDPGEGIPFAVYERRQKVLAAAADALDRLAALERELAEARKDGARLDWVIRNFEEVNFDGWHDHADMDAMDLDMEDEVLAAWRKYIDAAMGGE